MRESSPLKWESGRVEEHGGVVGEWGVGGSDIDVGGATLMWESEGVITTQVGEWGSGESGGVVGE